MGPSGQRHRLGWSAESLHEQTTQVARGQPHPSGEPFDAATVERAFVDEPQSPCDGRPGAEPGGGIG
jgi:hypothetical protein